MSTQLDGIPERLSIYIRHNLQATYFIVLGVILGSSYNSTLDLRGIIGTILSVCLSFGIYSWFRVFEPDSLMKMLYGELDESLRMKGLRRGLSVSSILVFLTPVLAGVSAIIPFIFVYLGAYSIDTGVRIALALDLFLMLVTGYSFSVENRIMAVFRTMILGFTVLLVCYSLGVIL